MKKLLLISASLGTLVIPAAPALAQATSPHTVSANIGLVSDYRFRGISQTFKNPAVQGGFDYSHSSGFYLGNWNSNVSGVQFPNGASLEMDFYGGWKTTFANDFSFDVGLLQYYYPGTKFLTAGGTEKADTLEGYIGLGWKFLSFKYSYAFTDAFGVNSNTFGGACNRVGTDCFGAAPGDSKGSQYFDLSASYEVIPKLTVVAHVGTTKVRHYDKLDYTDWKLGVVYDLNGWMLGAAYIDTNADENWYYATNGEPKTKETGKGTVVLSISRAF